MSQFTVQNSFVTNTDFIFVGEALTNLVKFTFDGISFTNNTCSKNSLISLNLYSQDINLINVNFINNTGIILKTNPNILQVSSTGDFNLKIQATNLVVQNNSNKDQSLILVTKRTRFTITGTIRDNVVLSKSGLFSIGQEYCQVLLEKVLIQNNFAFQGGIATVNYLSTFTCQECTIKENYAAKASIALVKNNGKVILNQCQISDNFGIKNHLIFLNGNPIAQSQINGSIINQTIVLNETQRYDKFKKLIVRKFPKQTNFQILDLELDRNILESQIHIQKSKFLFANTTILNITNLIDSVIDSQVSIQKITVTNTQFTNYIISSTLSKIKIDDSDFKFINYSLRENKTFIFDIKVKSDIQIKHSRFNSLNSSLISIHSSTLTIDNSSFINSTFDQNFIQSRISNLSFTNSHFKNVMTKNQIPLMQIFEKSVLLVNHVLIQEYTFKAIDIKDSQSSINLLNITNMIFDNAFQKDDVGGAIKLRNSYLTLNNSYFSNISSLSDGGAIYLYQEKNDRVSNQRLIKIHNSSFYSCNSTSGGAIYSRNSDIELFNNTLFNNSAQTGGAVYFSCCSDCSSAQPRFRCSHMFDANNCTKNKASLQGGCYFTDIYGPSKYLNSIYENNQAVYGQNYAAISHEIKRVNLTNSKYVVTTSNIVSVSGQPIDEPVYFAIYDIYNQIINIENSAIGKITSSKSDLVIEIQDQIISSQGVFIFDATQFTSRPGYNGTFTFYSDIIDASIYYKITGKNYTILLSNIILRYCTFGEAIEGSKCIICQQGYYSLVENAQNCEQCPDHATCYRAQINPDLGYWRSSNMSSQVTKCYYPYACLGGRFNSCDTSKGYTGILCHECAYLENDPLLQFTRDGEHQCARCPDTDTNIRIYLLIFFGNQVYIFFLTVSYYKNLVLEKENTVLLRIFTTYTQIINLIGSFDLNWPTIISNLFEGLGAPAKVTEALYSVDCLLKDFKIRGAEQTILISLIITSLQPLIQFVLSLIVYLFAWMCRVKQIRIKMLVSMTVIYYLTYPKIVKDTFSLFTCTPEIDGKKYLVKNTEIECFGPTHIKLITLLALPNMIVWIFGIPLIILYGLYKKRNDLDNVDNLRQYGFWYIGCKRSAFYWELILEFKKLMMISITVDITGMGQSYQAFLILMVLYFYFILSSNIKPYKTNYLNKVSYYSEFGQLCTFAFMMVYLRQSTNMIIDNLVFVLLIVMNSMFLLRFIYYLGLFYYSLFKVNYQVIKEKLKKSPQEIEDDKNNQSKDFDQIERTELEEKSNKQKRKKKRRKAPTGQVYMSSNQVDRVSKELQRKNSLESDQQNIDNNNEKYKLNQKHYENIQDQNSSQQGDSSPLSEKDKIQRKIEKIKVLKEKKKLLKRKLLIKDGPVGIKIDDYIREEKNRIKNEKLRDQNQTQINSNDTQHDKEQVPSIVVKDKISIKDFDLKKDKDGHLLNQAVLDQIKQLL